MQEFSSLSIYLEDKPKIEECRQLFLKEHPECKGMLLPDALIVRRMIRFFLKSP